MFRKPAVAVVILLTILAVPAAAWAGGQPSTSHTVTIGVAAVDAISVQDDGLVTVELVKREDGMGFLTTEVSEVMSLMWATNGSPRTIRVSAVGPAGITLQLKRYRDNTWIPLGAAAQTWVSPAGREAGASGVQSLSILYTASADLGVEPGSHDVEVTYTLTDC